MTECYRAIKRVDLSQVLPALGQVTFVHVNQGQVLPAGYPCDVVLEDKFPKAVTEFVAGLGLGGRQARAMLRRLAPRQNIPPHTDTWMPQDMDWRRFQVPLTSHPAIVMRWPDDGEEAHLEPGWLWEVRFDRTHEVIHGADCERIHMQIDQIDATIS